VLVTGAAALAAARDPPRARRTPPPDPDLHPISAPLAVRDVEEERRAMGRYFVAVLGRARAYDVLGLCRSWRPDVVVRDEVDFGAAIAAKPARCHTLP
jgi:hypothetical protein